MTNYNTIIPSSKDQVRYLMVGVFLLDGISMLQMFIIFIFIYLVRIGLTMKGWRDQLVWKFVRRQELEFFKPCWRFVEILLEIPKESVRDLLELGVWQKENGSGLPCTN